MNLEKFDIEIRDGGVGMRGEGGYGREGRGEKREYQVPLSSPLPPLSSSLPSPPPSIHTVLS